LIAGVLCLLAGIVAALGLPVMPPPLGGVICLLLAISLGSWRPVRACRWLLVGFGLAILEASALMADRMEAAHSGRDWLLEGQVEAVLSDRPARPTFLFQPQGPRLPSAIPRRIRLVWYDAPQVPAAGEHWRLLVRLREARGTANPHGFDYERWLLVRGIGATGYVRASSRNRRLAVADRFLDQIRGRIAETVNRHLGESETARLLEALIIGTRAGISVETRDKLTATGTAHLLAISGLHVGIAGASGGVALALLSWIFSSFTGVSAGRVRWFGAAAMACGYAMLVGFSIATRRALTMILVVTIAAACGRHSALSRGLVLAAWVVLLTQPLAPLDGGFWLSFGAVIVLCARFAGRLRPPARLASLVSGQVAISVGMIVPSLTLFGFVPVAAPLVNLAAVPIVAVIVLPAALLGAVLALVDPAFAFLPFKLAGLGLDAVLQLTDWAMTYGPLRLEAGAVGVVPRVCAAVACLLILGPAVVPGRLAAPAVLLALFLWRGHAPPPGGFDMTILDVGQGLSAVIRTHRHAMVYDAGPAWPGGDAGTMTVRPYLRGEGIPALDVLVVSHGDLDHAGGSAALLDRVTGRILAGPGTKVPGAEPEVCSAGTTWSWDGVRFEFLHPPTGHASTDNNASCVLRVDSRYGSALLPGDIESSAEQVLIRMRAELDADVLVAPHHGSATSSSPGFVDATAPEWIVYASGYMNRWGFPRDEVQQRWDAAGAKAVNTARDGAVTFVFGPGSGGPRVTGWRCLSRRFWRHRDCGNAEQD